MNDEELLKTLANKLKCEYLLCDLEKVDQIRNICLVLREEFENLDILINSASVGYYNVFKDVKLEEWERSYAVNVRAPFLLAKELLSILNKDEGGQIVNIGIDCGEEIVAGKSVYYANKHALRAWTLSLIKEFRGSNMNALHFCLGSSFSHLVPIANSTEDPKQINTLLGMSPLFVAETLVKILNSDNLNTEITLLGELHFS